MVQVNQKTKLSTIDNLRGPDEVEVRKVLLTTFLSSGLFDVANLLSIRDLANVVFTDGKASHPRWIKKPARPAESSDEDYAKLVIARVAPVLAKWEWINYDVVTDEDNLAVLALSCIQAGYPPRSNLDDCWTLLGDHALLPLVRAEDMPELGYERAFRAENEVLEKLDPVLLREGPYLESLKAKEAAKLEDLKKQLAGLSDADKASLGLNTTGAVPPSAAPPAAPPPVDVTAIASLIAGQVQLAVQGIADAFQQTVKESVSKEEKHLDVGQPDTDLGKFLDQQLAWAGAEVAGKKKEVSLEQMQLDSEIRMVEITQESRKMSGKDMYTTQFNQSIDEETVLLNQMASLDNVKVRPNATIEVLGDCKKLETTIL